MTNKLVHIVFKRSVLFFFITLLVCFISVSSYECYRIWTHRYDVIRKFNDNFCILAYTKKYISKEDVNDMSNHIRDSFRISRVNNIIEPTDAVSDIKERYGIVYKDKSIFPYIIVIYPDIIFDETKKIIDYLDKSKYIDSVEYDIGIHDNILLTYTVFSNDIIIVIFILVSCIVILMCFIVYVSIYNIVNDKI